jgi:hypothetical protein
LVHTLKTWPVFFKAVEDGIKPFELRKHDRLFAPGDTLVLQEYNEPEGDIPGGYTGKELIFEISYMLTDHQFPNGIKKGYCILGLKRTDEKS